MHFYVPNPDRRHKTGDIVKFSRGHYICLGAGHDHYDPHAIFRLAKFGEKWRSIASGICRAVTSRLCVD